MNALDIRMISCRPVAEDARRIMDWRNDTQTLAMFYHHEPKRWPDFFDEYSAEYFRDDRLPPLFAMLDDQPVAFLRFQAISASDISEIDVSINVDPGRRGLGIAPAALTAASRLLREQGVQRIFAEIRVENTASQASFLKAGYVFDREEDKTIEDTGETCRIRRYVLALAPTIGA